MKCFGVALALAGGLTLLPPASWAGSVMRGGRVVPTPGVATKGGVVSVGKSGAVSGPVLNGGLVRVRQPCDIKVRNGFGSVRGFGPARFGGPSYLIVDVTPLDAQVFLDGRWLGSAGQLVARAFPLSPGSHGVEIVAPGFRPYVTVFTVDPSFPRRLRVALQPE